MGGQVAVILGGAGGVALAITLYMTALANRRIVRVQQQLTEMHTANNSRLDQLVVAVTAQALAEGKEIGADEERARAWATAEAEKIRQLPHDER